MGCSCSCCWAVAVSTAPLWRRTGQDLEWLSLAPSLGRPRCWRASLTSAPCSPWAARRPPTRSSATAPTLKIPFLRWVGGGLFIVLEYRDDVYLSCLCVCSSLFVCLFVFNPSGPHCLLFCHIPTSQRKAILDYTELILQVLAVFCTFVCRLVTKSRFVCALDQA